MQVTKRPFETYTLRRSGTINRTDLKKLTAEELMVIYQQYSPEEAFVAFNELYVRFGDKVFSYVMKKLRNQSDAEDLLQKIFFKVHESKHLYNVKYKFEQWLFVIARTSVLDHFRSKNRYEKKLSRISEEMILPPDANANLSTELLSPLSEDQKEMLEMKYIDEMSYQEMAALLNKSETSLRKMVSRMMMNLKKGDA